MVGQGILSGEAVLALFANVRLLVQMGGLVLLKFGPLVELLLTELADAKAVFGVGVDVARKFALVFCCLGVIATNPATFEFSGSKIENVRASVVFCEINMPISTYSRGDWKRQEYQDSARGLPRPFYAALKSM